MKEQDSQDIRIQKILGNDCSRGPRTVLKYYKFLKTSVKLPCSLTGIEDFPWEEPYVLGGWDKGEYKRLKKDNPSYKDTYELIEILKPEPDEEDIQVKVKRVSGKKVFEIGLSWLECINKEDDKYQLIDDYAVWHTNY